MKWIKEVGSPQGGFKLHKKLCKITNDGIISNEEDRKNRWKTYF
jgi:hypothetical protein